MRKIPFTYGNQRMATVIWHVYFDNSTQHYINEFEQNLFSSAWCSNCQYWSWQQVPCFRFHFLKTMPRRWTSQKVSPAWSAGTVFACRDEQVSNTPRVSGRRIPSPGTAGQWKLVSGGDHNGWTTANGTRRVPHQRCYPSLIGCLLYKDTVNMLLRAQWLRGRASDSQLREPWFDSWLRC